MKKNVSMLIIFLMACLNSNAYDIELNGIYYDLVKKAKVAKVSHDWNNDYSGDIVIPTTITYEGVTYTVVSILDYAFSGCKNLNSVILPESLTSIGEHVFANSSIKEIVIPNSVSEIGKYTFSQCYSLESVTLPSSLTKIEYQLFRLCNKLKSITIPDNVTEIGDMAFEDCYALCSVSLSKNLQLIGKQGFRGCKSLEEIVIPDGLLAIGAQAFWQCAFKTINIPNSVLGVGADAFRYNKQLSKVYLGKNVIFVYDEAFADCKELADFYSFPNSVPNIYEDGEWNINKWNGVFNNSEIEYATLHVPESSINEYKSKPYWKEFGNIVALTEQDTGVSPVNTYNEKTVEKVFSIEGKHMDSPKKGINIIRMSDGTTKKVIIK